MFKKSMGMRAFIGLCVVYAIANPIHLCGAPITWTNGSTNSCMVVLPNSWSPAVVPGTGDEAIFDTGDNVARNVPYYAVVPNPWTPGQIAFHAAPYVMVVGSSLSFAGSTLFPPGVTNTSFATQIFKISNSSNASTGSILFTGAGCTADAAYSGAVYYNLEQAGIVTFDSTSIANNANFNVTGPGSILTFQGSSSADISTIKTFSGGSVIFTASAFASSANMTADGGFIVFEPLATINSGNSANVTLINSGTLDINQQNTLQSLNTDQTSAVHLISANPLTITGSAQTMTIAGPVTGAGSLVFNNLLDSAAQRTTTFLLSAANSYAGPTTVSGNNNLVGNTTSLANSVVVNNIFGFTSQPTLTFDQDFSGIFLGNITGTGTSAQSVVITGGGEVQIPSGIGIPAGNTSSVAVPVTVMNGTLIGDTGSLLSDITLNNYGSELIFRQTASGTFARNIFAGTNGAVGTVLVDSPGTVTTFTSPFLTAGLFHLKTGNAIVHGNNVVAPVVVDNDTTLVLDSTTSVFANNISGSGGVQVGSHSVLTQVTLSGVNSYTGGTLVGTNVDLLGNTLSVQGNIQFSDSSGIVAFDQSGGPHSPVTNGVFSGNISGLGTVVIQGGLPVTFTGTNNSYPFTFVTGAGTNWIGTTNSLQGNVELQLGAQITFNQSFLGDFLGNITSPSSTGTMLVTGGGRVNLLGVNTFSGPITVASGTLEGNTLSIQQNISNFGTVQFTQLTNGTYSQSITGTGNLVKAGPGKLSLITPQTATNTYVKEGELNLNTTLNGNGTVESGGILSGVGTVTGNLSVLSGGVLKPGNSIGTMHIGGNVFMDVDSQYPVQINGAGNATDTIAAGTIQLVGGEVDVTSADGTFLLNTPYQIMHSNTPNGLTGTFSIVQAHGFFNPDVVDAEALYDPQNAYVILQTTFDHCPLTQNQANIAFQLDNLINPPADIQALLQELVVLPCDEIAFVFDEMSGLQYAGEMVVADMTNRQFIRRLFDPLRDILRTPPCCKSYSMDCCEEMGNWGHEIWVEAGGTRLSIDNGHEGYGLKANGYEVVGGLQHMFDEEWVVGLAGGYFEDQIHFHLPGKGKMHTVDVGLYALYRPNAYYLLGDLTFGTTSDKLHRTVAVGDFSATMQSKTRIYQGTFYAEAGTDVFMDWALFGCVLLQPFAGIELGYAHRSKITEHQGGSLNLELDSKSFFKSFSRLGFHFNTMPELGQMQLTLDLAWNYRLADAGRTSKERFTAFGTSFDIEGAPEQKSSFDGALALIVPAGKYINFYFEVAGQKWQSASTGSVYGGIQTNW